MYSRDYGFQVLEGEPVAIRTSINLLNSGHLAYKLL